MSDLPSGTVTFLFTDIEGSTKLLGRLGTAYAALLHEHQQLLREAFAAHGGVESGTEGDSFFVAFARATDAVAACADAQLALSGYPWPSEAEIRVRMGLHTGEARVHDGQYVGMAVHLAARVAAAGHGGQMLLSETTVRLLAGALPAMLELHDLGLYSLKDFPRAERIFQLLHPDLRQSFPPLTVPAVIAGNLPRARTAFIGRDRELQELRKLLEETPLVTLVGAGGVGKTRLAIEVARLFAADRPDGVWLVELAALTDSDAVPAAVLAALGFELQPTRRPVDVLLENLRARAVLLVIDNCEHLVAACADLIDRLLAECPQVAVIATSREPLGVDGERPWRLPSLSVPVDGSGPLEELVGNDAVRLFLDRVSLVRPGFALSTANADAVVSICRRLDGIPLAIELAAARVRALSVEAIATRLDDRFALLTGGARSALSRQQTLRALVDWSHDLLSEPERIVLRRLSVFTDGFTLDGAEEVVPPAEAGGLTVLDQVGALVDKSLLALDDETGRFRMLETVRQYAQEKLLAAGGEATELRDRHLAWCLGYAKDAVSRSSGPGERAALDEVQEEYGNLTAGLEWAVASRATETALAMALALRPFWAQRGRIGEGRERLLTLLDLPDQPPILRARALAALAGLGSISNHPDCRGEAERAHAAAQAADDAEARNIALNALASTASTPEEGVSWSLQGLLLSRVRGRPDVEQACLVQTGRHRLQTGDVEGARRDIAEAIVLAESLDSDNARFFALYHSATLDRRLGRLGAAQEQAQRAVELARRLGDGRLEAEVHAWQLSPLALLLGDPELAKDHLKASVVLARRVGLLTYVASASNELGYVQAVLGQFDQARQSLQYALAVAGTCGFPAANVEHSLAQLEQVCGNTDAAQAAYLALVGSADASPEIVAASHLGLGWLAQSAGRSADALDRYRRALPLTAFDAQIAETGLHVAALATYLGRQESAARLVLAVGPGVDALQVAMSLALRMVWQAAAPGRGEGVRPGVVDRDVLSLLIGDALDELEPLTR